MVGGFLVFKMAGMRDDVAKGDGLDAILYAASVLLYDCGA